MLVKSIDLLEPGRKKVRFHMSHQNIEKGIRQSSTRCPVALMLRDRRVKFEHVYGATVSVTHGQTVPLPKLAQNFISRFDGRADRKKRILLKPISFFL